MTTSRLPGFWLAVFLAAGLMVFGAGGTAHAATTFTVDNTIDPGNGTCSAAAGCTLREAIAAANEAPGADTINFDIPGSGVRSIAPGSKLPEITEAVTINGYSQPGTSPNTLARGTNALLLVQLDGTNAGETSGLDIEAKDVVVRGLVINRWTDGSGIFVSDGAARATGVRIEGNFIGTDPSGTQDLGNRDNGVQIFDASGATVGGTVPAARNLISGNGSAGVAVTGSGFDAIAGNKVQGNLIGTQKNGRSALGNSGAGVRISATGTTVGGSIAASNTIAFNSEGVAIRGEDDPSGNRVLGNSISANSGLGINLGFDGSTPNDPRDPDAGPNRLQNFPVITSARNTLSGAVIEGTLDSTPSTRKKKRTFTVQFFATSSGDDEGEAFLGQKRVTTSRKGKASFTFKVGRLLGGGEELVTATATSPGGNTSEFSDPVVVKLAPGQG